MLPDAALSASPRPAPYWGVTGLTTLAHAALLRDLVARVPRGTRLMAGLLLDDRTLQGTPVRNRRYVLADDAAALVRALGPTVWPVAHYNTHDRATLGDQLAALVARVPGLGGLQLNVPGLTPAELAALRTRLPEGLPIILQVSHLGGADPALVRAYLADFEGLLQYALFDASRGEGKLPGSLDAGYLRWTLLDWPFPTLAPAIAGGLGPQPDAARRVFYLTTGHRPGAPPGEVPTTPVRLTHLRGLSFDCESGVRVPCSAPIEGASGQDDLDPMAVRAWIETLAGVAQLAETV